MTEYIIRHEQLEKIFDWIDKLTIAAYGEEYEGLIGKRLALYEQLEVPPLVRCKNCRSYDEEVEACSEWGYCGIDNPDGFCAWGKPREGNDK